MRWRRRVAVLVLVVAAAALILALRPTEEKRVPKQLDRLAARFSKESGESTTVMAVKMHTFTDLLADEVTLEFQGWGANGTSSASELGSMLTRIRPQFAAIALTFHDVRVDVRRPAATVNLTARLVLTAATGGAVTEDTREVLCRLQKVEKTWRFSSFTEVNVMER